MGKTGISDASEHIERMLYGSRVGKPREITMSELIQYDESGFGFRWLIPPFTDLVLSSEEVLEELLVRVNGPVHLKEAAKRTFRDAIRGEVRTRREFVRRLNIHFRRPHPTLAPRSRPQIRGAKVEELLAFANSISAHPRAGALAAWFRRCVRVNS